MNEELYSFDKYKGHSIFVIEDHGMYYADVWFNGTEYWTTKGLTPESALEKAKLWVDENEY